MYRKDSTTSTNSGTTYLSYELGVFGDQHISFSTIVERIFHKF